MTGYQSKKAAALDEDGMYLVHHTAQPAQPPYSVQQAYAMAQVCLDLHEALGCKWGDNVYLTISQLKAAHGIEEITNPPAAQPEQERNFCPRCGKRTADLTVIHTCTPPQENT